jgi:hypothetical protein
VSGTENTDTGIGTKCVMNNEGNNCVFKIQKLVVLSFIETEPYVRHVGIRRGMPDIKSLKGGGESRKSGLAREC